MKRLFFFLLILCASLSLTGCLSLSIGGKTHNCGNDKAYKEYQEHIARLESRIGMLEQYAGIQPTPSREPAGEVSVASWDSVALESGAKR